MPIVKKYKAKIDEINCPIEDIYTITFSSNKKFLYNPGQFLHLSIDEYDPSLPWPESRCFSIQTNPDEEKLKITFAKKGQYTKRMIDNLKVGQEVWLKLPYGDIFDRNHSKENCVFIAGGTGVTPFLSLFNSSEFAHYKNPFLYLGLRAKHFNIYSDLLNKAREINKDFDINYKYQDKDGMLNIEEIYLRHNNTVYFISGPPIMIKKFKDFLLSKNIPEKLIITDDWE